MRLQIPACLDDGNPALCGQFSSLELELKAERLSLQSHDYICNLSLCPQNRQVPTGRRALRDDTLREWAKQLDHNEVPDLLTQILDHE